MSVPGEMVMQAGAVAAVSDAVRPELSPEQKKANESEQSAVAKHWKEYEEARKFDDQARKQYAVDRRYAAGTADQRWAVDTNLIGSYIDILVSFLYAQDPDVSVKKSPRVNSRGSKRDEDFAKTMELVISTLWKRGRLKAAVKKQVRSALSVGIGWTKNVLICDGPNVPQMQANLRDARDNIARLEAITAGGHYGDKSPEAIQAEQATANELAISIERKIEVTIRKSLAVDFVAAQDMQVSLDVQCIDDYLNANWLANSIYRLKSELKELFPKLTDEACKTAKIYYQRQQKDMQPLTDTVQMGAPGNGDDAEQYTSSNSAGSNTENGPEFAKIVEKWDHRTNHVYTMVEGVKEWAKAPYQPDYPSTRFFPYFQLAFYPVDGARMPQSLSWRLHKLQDEYAGTRSAERITRQRSVPGVIFNRGQVDPADIKQMADGTYQEFLGIQPTDPAAPIGNLFAPKPVPSIDGRLYDVSAIVGDMEKMSGVQEALQSSVSTAKTATEANIQQTGFASRTDADRDTLEDMLTDMANYTGEVTLTALSLMDAQRIAGDAAFWPAGMDIEDILTLLQIEIEAGTTGKPKAAGDKENWGVLLPQLKELIVQIEQALLVGNTGGANALIELLRETFIRLGDETDIERFIPQVPAMPQPGMPGAPVPGGPPLGDEMVPPGLSDQSLQPAGSIAPAGPVGSSTPQLA